MAEVGSYASNPREDEKLQALYVRKQEAITLLASCGRSLEAAEKASSVDGISALMAAARAFVHAENEHFAVIERLAYAEKERR